MEYYTEYFNLMKQFSSSYDSKFFDHVVKYYEDKLKRFETTHSYNDKNTLDVVVSLSEDYLKLHGFHLCPYDERLRRGDLK